MTYPNHNRSLFVVAFAVGALFLLGTASTVSAQTEMTGVRAMGMGDAFTAQPTGAGALFHNPAGISALMMYSVEASYVHDQVDGLNIIHASIVDGKSNPNLGGGIGYTFSVSSSNANRPSFEGHDFYGAMAMPVVPGWVIAGAEVHYLDYTQSDRDLADGVTFDGGVLVSLGDFFSFGTAVRNINEQENSGRPLEASFGLAFRMVSLALGVDTILSFADAEGPYTSYAAGLEYLVGGIVPVRVGYQRDGQTDHNIISGGAGYRSELFGLDAVFRQDLDQTDARLMGLALNLYL